MAEPVEVQNGSPPGTTRVRPLLSIWKRLGGFGLKRLFLVCAGIGVGMGIVVAAVVASVVWLSSRPIQARDWPHLEFEGMGLKAKLRTDYDSSVRYQLAVLPISNELKAAFNDGVRANRDSISFTVHLYDKAGFELCKKDVKPTAIIGTAGRIDGLQANDTFYSFECSRSDYKKADHWNLSWVFPALTANIPADGGATQHESDAKTKAVTNPRIVPLQEYAPIEEDDTLTGFDLFSGHLETLSGGTFLVREGEKSVASMWGYRSEILGEAQPRLHIACKTKGDCIIENITNQQAVHGRKLK